MKYVSLFYDFKINANNKFSKAKRGNKNSFAFYSFNSLYNKIFNICGEKKCAKFQYLKGSVLVLNYLTEGPVELGE